MQQLYKKNVNVNLTSDGLSVPCSETNVKIGIVSYFVWLATLTCSLQRGKTLLLCFPNIICNIFPGSLRQG